MIFDADLFGTAAEQVTSAKKALKGFHLKGEVDCSQRTRPIDGSVKENDVAYTHRARLVLKVSGKEDIDAALQTLSKHLMGQGVRTVWQYSLIRQAGQDLKAETRYRAQIFIIG